MKFTQTDTQIELKSNGLGQLIAGLVFLVAGIVLMFVLLAIPSDNGKKAPLWSVLFGLVFAAIGAMVTFTAQNRTTTIVRGGNATIRAKRLLGGNPEEQSVPTANIVAVRLSTRADYSAAANDDTMNQRRSVLALVLANNDLIEVGSAGSRGIFRTVSISPI